MKMNVWKRLLALFLCLAMLLPYLDALPIRVWAATDGTGTIQADPLATVYAGSDFQYKSTTYGGVTYEDARKANGALMKDLLKRIKQDHSRIDKAFVLGDYAAPEYGDLAASNSGVAASYQALNEVFGLTDDKLSGNSAANQINFVQGNHDPAATEGLDATGAYDTEHYGVFQINHDDFPTDANGVHEAKVIAVADKLAEYLDAKVNAGYDKPIFVITHVPLHHTYRVDNPYASYLFNIINEAGKELNIIFMFGHNHSWNYDNYLGGSNICLLPGSEMLIADLEERNAGTDKVEAYKSVTLNFTYLNPGYLGYTSGGTLSSVVFEIYEDRVEMFRYSRTGLCNLKNEGVSYKPANTTSKDGSWEADTSVVESPYVLSLSKIKLTLVSEPLEAYLAPQESAQLQVAVESDKDYTICWTSDEADVLSVIQDADDPTKATITAGTCGSVTLKVTATAEGEVPATLYFDIVVVPEGAVNFNDGQRPILYKLVEDWSTLTTDKEYMILSRGTPGSAYALGGPTPESASRDLPSAAYMTNVKVLTIPGEDGIYTNPVNGYDVYKLYPNAEETAFQIGHVSDENSFLGANSLIDSQLSYSQKEGYRMCSTATSDGASWWTLDTENRMLNLHSFYESTAKAVLTPSKAFKFNYNPSDSCFQLRAADDTTGGPIYFYESCGTRLPEIWMWLTADSGTLELGGDTLTGATVSVMKDGQITQVPITADMLVDGYVTVPGNRTCTVSCFGQTISDQFRLTVKTQDDTLVEPVVLLQNNGDLFRYQEVALDGQTFVTVDRKTAGDGYAMTVTEADGTYILQSAPSKVFTVDGLSGLYVQSQGDGWLWDQELSSKPYYYIKNRLSGGYLKTDGTALLFTLTPEEAWRTNTTHYTLTEVDTGLVIEHSGSSYVAAKRIGSAGGVGYIYVPETRVDRIIAYMTDRTGSMIAGSDSLSTGETISHTIFYKDGTFESTKIPVTLSMLDISYNQLLTPGDHMCKVIYKDRVICEDFLLTVEQAAELPVNSTPVLLTGDGDRIFMQTTNLADGQDFVFINTGSAGIAQAFAVKQENGQTVFVGEDVKVFQVEDGTELYAVVNDGNRIWRAEGQGIERALYNEANSGYVFMRDGTDYALEFGPQPPTCDWRGTSAGYLGTRNTLNAALAWTGSTYVGCDRNKMGTMDYTYTRIFQESTAIASRAAYLDAGGGSVACGSVMGMPTGTNLVIKTLMADNTVGTDLVPITLDMLEGLDALDLFIPGTYTCSVVYEGKTISDNYQLTVTPAEGENAAADIPVALLRNEGQIFMLDGEVTPGKHYVFVDRSTAGVGYVPAITMEGETAVISALPEKVYALGDSGNVYVVVEEAHRIWTATEDYDSEGNAIVGLSNKEHDNRLFVNEEYALTFGTVADARALGLSWCGNSDKFLCFGNDDDPVYAAIKRNNSVYATINRKLTSSLDGGALVYRQDSSLDTILAYVDQVEGSCPVASGDSTAVGGNVVIKKVMTDGRFYTEIVPITLDMLGGISDAQRMVPDTYECTVNYDGKVLTDHYQLSVTAGDGDPLPASGVVSVLETGTYYRLLTSAVDWKGNGTYILVNQKSAGTAYAMSIQKQGDTYQFVPVQGTVHSPYEGGPLFFATDDPNCVLQTHTEPGIDYQMLMSKAHGEYLFVTKDYELVMTDFITAKSHGHGFRFGTDAAVCFGASSHNPYATIQYNNGAYGAVDRSTDTTHNNYIYMLDESIRSQLAYTDSLTGHHKVGDAASVACGGSVVLRTIVNGKVITQTVPIVLGMLDGISVMDLHTPGTYTCKIYYNGKLITDQYELTVEAGTGDLAPADVPVYLVEDIDDTYYLTNEMVKDSRYVVVNRNEAGNAYYLTVQSSGSVYQIASATTRVLSDGSHLLVTVKDSGGVWETAYAQVENPNGGLVDSLSMKNRLSGTYLTTNNTLRLILSNTVPTQVGWRLTGTQNLGTSSKCYHYVDVVYSGDQFFTEARNQDKTEHHVYLYAPLSAMDNPIENIIAYVTDTSGSVEAGASGKVLPGGNVVIRTCHADGTISTESLPITLNMLKHDSADRPLEYEEFNTPDTYEYAVYYEGVKISSSYRLTVTGDEKGNLVSYESNDKGVLAYTLQLDNSGQYASIPGGLGGTTPTGSILVVYQYTDSGEVVRKEVPVILDMLSDPTGRLDWNKGDRYTGLTVTYQGMTVATDYDLNLVDIVYDDYPDFPNEGSVHVNKQMDTTKYNYLQTGSAQINLSVAGIPITNKANVVVVLDASSSMLECTHGIASSKDVPDDKRPIVDKAFAGKTLTADEITFLQSLDFEDLSEPGEYRGLLQQLIDGTIDDNGRVRLSQGMRVYGMCYDKQTNTYKWVGDTEKHCKRRSIVTQEALAELVEFLQQDMDGYEMDIDIAVVYFNQWNPIRSDLVFTGHSLLETTPRSSDELMLPFTNSKEVVIADVLARYKTMTGTNYDRGMEWIYQLLSEKQTRDYQEYLAGNSALPFQPRQDFVLFMSDGEPNQFNYMIEDAKGQFTEYYKGTIPEGQLAQYVSAENLDIVSKMYNPEGKLWLAEAIKGDRNQKYKIIDPSMPETDYINSVTGLGATMMTVTLNARAPVMYLIASSEDYYIPTETGDDIREAFKAFGSLVTSASGAYFKDEMGPEFDLQMNNSLTVELEDGTKQTVPFDPTITVSVHELNKYSEYLEYQHYLDNKESWGDQKVPPAVTMDQVGKHKPGAQNRDLEKITFSDDGTQAYSDQIGGGKTNILVNDVICAKYFWYNTNTGSSAMIDVDGDGTAETLLEPETFYWSVGTIPEDELVLTYNVYLTDTLEGLREEGSYPTNEYATLHYTNHLGNECELDTTSPMLPWNQAVVGYAFYLVDANGDPLINEDQHITGSFEKAIRMTQPQYIDLLYNSADNVAPFRLDASKVLPAGYSLYDPTAAYLVSLYANGEGSWEVSGSADKLTTYVTGYGGDATTQQTAHAGVGEEGLPAYATAATVVWFAVRADVNTVPDTVVIDYGISVDSHVLANDVVITNQNATIAGIGTLRPGDADSVDFTQTLAEGFTGSYTGKFGSAQVMGDVVRYTLKDMQMTAEDRFSYAADYRGEKSNGFYYSTVTVIPATNIYFEDNFVTFDGKWQSVGQAQDAVQDEDRAGSYHLPSLDANNVYGYDSAYTNMTTWSMGSAMVARVSESDPEAVAKFTFTGTGFDILSYCSSDTGAITVSIYEGEEIDENKLVTTWMVDSYYGCIAECYKVTFTYTNGKWERVEEQIHRSEMGTTEPQPKEPEDGDTYVAYLTKLVPSNKGDEVLYQVPVIKHEGLPYNTYTVEIYVGWAWWLAQNRPNYAWDDFYLDAIRIYDPANDGAGSEVVKDAYVADKEGWPSYQELRNLLITVDTFDALEETDEVEGVVFIDGIAAAGTANIAEYINFGPNNELYLAPGQAIAFNLNVGGSDENVAAIHLGLASVGGTAIAKVYNAVLDHTAASERRLSSATQQYYDISDLDGKTVVIANVGSAGDASISVTDLKTTYKNPPKNTGRLTMNRTAARKALASLMAEQPQPVLTPKYPTLSFESEVVYNVYFAAENPVAPENMGLAIFDSTGTQLLERVPGAVACGELYMVSSNGINAKNLGDETYFKVYADLADGSTVYSGLYSYSALKYAENVLSGSYTDPHKALVVAMLNYGAAAQTLFDHKADSLMNSGLTAQQQALVSGYSADSLNRVGTVDEAKVGSFASNGGFTAKYPTVSFEGVFSIHYYFTPEKAVDGDMTFYYWTEDTYNAATELTADNADGKSAMTATDGIYHAVSPELAAKELDKTVYVAAVYESQGVTYSTGVLAYSLAAYCQGQVNSADPATGALANAAAIYGCAAKTYFGS